MKAPLIGNKRVCDTLQSMIKFHRLPHAIVLEGENGLGKKTLARYIAKACLCAAEEKPCLSCKSCHLVEVGSHPDYLLIEPQGTSIKVDQIRYLRSEAFLQPLSADGRVFVIDAAHTMNEQAQNALLKVLEEPPGGVTFLLLAKSASFLLETIRSRAVCFSLLPVALEDAAVQRVATLSESSLADAERSLCAADGNIGRAVAALTEETVLLSAVANELLTFAAAGDRLQILLTLQPYSKRRDEVKELLYELKAALSREIKKKAVKEYSSFTTEWLNESYNALTKLETQLPYNPSLSLLFCRIAAVLTHG